MHIIQANQVQMTIENIPSGQIGTIIMESEPKMKKRGNPYLMEDVKKRTEYRVLFHFDYGTAVNRRREKAGLPADFIPSPRAWGQKVEGSKSTISHNGFTYSALMLIGKGESTYTVNGDGVDEEDLSQWLPASRSSELTELTIDEAVAMHPDELEEWAVANVNYRDFKHCHVAEMRANKETFKVVR